jgi:hypothetical protein
MLLGFLPFLRFCFLQSLYAAFFGGRMPRVSEYDGLDYAHSAEPSALIIMQIRATNSAMAHAYQNVVHAQITEGDVLNTQVVLFMKDTSFHGHNFS